MARAAVPESSPEPLVAHGFLSQGLAQELQDLAARQASAGGQAKEGLAFLAQIPCPDGFRWDPSGRPGGRLSHNLLHHGSMRR